MGGGRRLRRLVVALAALAAVAAAGAAAPRVHAQTRATIVFGGDPSSGVSVSFGGGGGPTPAGIQFILEPSATVLPRKLELDVPAGYKLDLTAQPGDDVAIADLSIASIDQPSFADGFGNLTADDPAKYVSDPAAQACAPGTHAAVWTTSFSIVGQKADVTIFVDEGGAGGGSYTLTTCPTGLGSGGGRTQISLAIVDLEALTPPTAPGRYVWRTVVTPQTEQGYELQALVPLPEAVTVHVRFDRRTHAATLTGKVLEAGKPVAGAVVGFGASTEQDIPTVRTKADGSYSVRTTVKRTTDFEANVQPSVGTCELPAVSPGGCLSSDTVPPDNVVATVWVSAPGGPVRATRPADQRLAEREDLSAASLSPDFTQLGLPGHACQSQGHESDLTITGESASPVFASLAGTEDAPQLIEPSSLVRVYASAPQARRAFAREALTATARCEMTSFGLKRPKIAPFRLTGLAAATRGFRTIVPVTKTAKANFDILFLVRGRSVVRLRIAVVGLPPAVERALVAKVAARMR